MNKRVSMRCFCICISHYLKLMMDDPAHIVFFKWIIKPYRFGPRPFRTYCIVKILACYFFLLIICNVASILLQDLHDMKTVSMKQQKQKVGFNLKCISNLLWYKLHCIIINMKLPQLSCKTCAPS